MLRLGSLRDYRWPVTVPVVLDDGSRGELTYTAVFARLPQPRIDALLERGKAGEVLDAALLDEVLVGWGDDVLDAAGQPAPFTAETAAELLAIPGARYATAAAWFDSIRLGPEKN